MMPDDTKQEDVALTSLKAQFEQKVKNKIDAATAQKEKVGEQPEAAGMEKAEPQWWWNLWAYGPFQIGPHLKPHEIIRAGESFCVATVVWLNPWWPGQVSSCELLTNLCGKLKIKYCTAEVCDWKKGPAPLNVEHVIDFIPNQCWYVDYLCIHDVPAGWEGCYEMNICAQVCACENKPNASLPFAGYASHVYSFDYDYYPLGGPPNVSPHWRIDIPTRFMIYDKCA